MKLVLAFSVSLFGANAVHAQGPALPLTFEGKTPCPFEVDYKLKQQIGLSIFQVSDRMITAEAEDKAQKLMRIMFDCLGKVDKAVEQSKPNLTTAQYDVAKDYVAGRYGNALAEIRAGMMRAGYRPSTAAPRRYTVCEYEMEFGKPVVPVYQTNSIWSPVFYDREADSSSGEQGGGRTLTKVEAQVVALMRVHAKKAYKPFVKEFVSCEQFYTNSAAFDYREGFLKDGQDAMAKISIPASLVPIN